MLFVSTPFILSRLGNEAFGLYLVALSVAGFAGLLDLGLGTASIKFVSEYRARGDSKTLSDVVNTLLLTRLPQALAVACLGYLSAPFICRRILVVSPKMQPEAVFVVRMSVVTLAAGLIGGSLAALPRALHRFDVASRVGTLHGLLLTACTVGVLALGYGLREIVLLELLLGVLSLTLSAVVARRDAARVASRAALRPPVTGTAAALRQPDDPERPGGLRLPACQSHPDRPRAWDRHGTVLCDSVESLVASHATDEFADGGHHARGECLSADKAASHLRALYERSLGLTAIVATTILVPVSVGAPDLLALWLGPTFGERGGSVLRILALGAVVQSLSAAPYFLLTGIGQPVAANAPPLVAAILNIVFAAVLLPAYGLNGVALAILIGIAAKTLMLIRSVEGSIGAVGAAARTLARPLVAAVVAVTCGLTIASRIHEPHTRLVVQRDGSAGTAVAARSPWQLRSPGTPHDPHGPVSGRRVGSAFGGRGCSLTWRPGFPPAGRMFPLRERALLRGAPSLLRSRRLAGLSFTRSAGQGSRLPEFRLRRCGACGFQWTSPQPAESMLRQLYEGASGEYFEPLAEASPDRRRVYRAVQTLLDRYGMGEGRLLDLGCATGEALRAFRESFELFGVEPSRFAAARARDTTSATVHVGD